jgi:uncharacterized Zn finger protein (UPF0148 family)
MWECGHCGTYNIASDLMICPNCGKEREMPKTTAAGSSNAWEADEGEAAAEEETAAQAETPQAEAPPPETDGYDEMSLAELQDMARERGLPVSGTKAQLAQALRDGDAGA